MKIYLVKTKVLLHGSGGKKHLRVTSHHEQESIESLETHRDKHYQQHYRSTTEAMKQKGKKKKGRETV